jgi:hypothetical protein
VTGGFCACHRLLRDTPQRGLLSSSPARLADPRAVGCEPRGFGKRLTVFGCHQLLDYTLLRLNIRVAAAERVPPI